jgi:hypothetical protein
MNLIIEYSFNHKGKHLKVEEASSSKFTNKITEEDEDFKNLT